ncbi:S8 family serine peptidase [Kitasatospora cineracea]|uniref:S8 family serine peptidase n=1 Tax=Kitasatospora cineracea TaxID=88074 RepID=UPI003827BD1C
MSSLPPWRRPPRGHFPGVPAWGAPTTRSAPDPFEITPLAGIDPDWAWGGADGSGVRVCVIDSGVEGGHPLVGELDRVMSVEAGDDGALTVEPCEPTDPAGHGTACAGVIRSVAPGAELSSVRVLSRGKTGTGAALLTGLGWAIDEGFDIINLSLSTAKPDLCLALYELADRAYFRRCLLVVSAHNMPVRSFPWPFASVVSVASHDEPDPLLHYYNPSPPVEFYARGVGVRVARPGGGATRSTGNSFAAPHISGLAALILGKHRSLTPFQLKSVLYSTARNVAGNGEHADRTDRTAEIGDPCVLS